MAGEDRPHPLWARLYAGLAERAEEKGAAEYRSELVAGVSGEVLEVGCGPGFSFPHYPAGARVEAVEPEPHLRRLAETRAPSAAASVHVAPGRAERLPFDDARFDAVVFSYVLCTVDPDTALAEALRVLQPGGELRFWEHVRALNRPLSLFQTMVDWLFWPRFGAGCHTARDPLPAIEGAGFTGLQHRRFWFAPGGVFPAGPQLLGRAHRP